MKCKDCKECMHKHTCDKESKEDFVQVVWIKVEDRMPEPFVSVLGYMTDADLFPAVRECYMLNNGSFYFPALNEHHPISHWMPMPEPPKEGDLK